MDLRDKYRPDPGPQHWVPELTFEVERNGTTTFYDLAPSHLGGGTSDDEDNDGNDVRWPKFRPTPCIFGTTPAVHGFRPRSTTHNRGSSNPTSKGSKLRQWVTPPQIQDSDPQGLSILERECAGPPACMGSLPMSKIASTQPTRVRLQLETPRLQRQCSIALGRLPAKGKPEEYQLNLIFCCVHCFVWTSSFFPLPDLAPDFPGINIPTLDYET